MRTTTQKLVSPKALILGVDLQTIVAATAGTLLATAIVLTVFMTLTS